MSLNEYEQNLDKFYKLKSEYTMRMDREKMRIISNKELSRKEKRLKFNETTVKCINCGRRGGTVFETKQDQFRVICGNTDSPCSLNINFQRQKRDLVDKKVVEYIDILSSLKEQIIRIKLEYLMGFISEEDSIVQFTTVKKELTDKYDVYREIIEKYHKVVNNLDNQEEISQLHRERQELISQIKTRVQKYNFNGNLSNISEIVEIYLGDLDKVLTNLRTLQYQKMYIDESVNDEKRLIKDEFFVKDLEIQK